MWNYNYQTEQTIYPANHIPAYNQYFDQNKNTVVDSINWPFLDNVDPNSLLTEDHFHTLKQISRMFVRATIIELPPKGRAIKLFQILQIIITKLSNKLDKVKENTKDIAKQNKIYKEKIINLESTKQPQIIKNVANKCPICYKPFKSSHDLDLHVFTRHKEVATLWQAIKTPQPPNSFSFPLNQNVDSTMHPPSQRNENQEKLEGILNNFKERVTNGRIETEQSLKNYIDRKMDRLENKFDDYQQDKQRQLAYQKKQLKKYKSHKQNRCQDHLFHGTHNRAYYNALNSEQHQQPPPTQQQPQQQQVQPTKSKSSNFQYVPPIVAESKKQNSTVKTADTHIQIIPEPISDNPKIIDSDSNPFFIEPTPKKAQSGSDAEYDSVPSIQTQSHQSIPQSVSQSESEASSPPQYVNNSKPMRTPSSNSGDYSVSTPATQTNPAAKMDSSSRHSSHKEQTNPPTDTNQAAKMDSSSRHSSHKEQTNPPTDTNQAAKMDISSRHSRHKEQTNPPTDTNQAISPANYISDSSTSSSNDGNDVFTVLSDQHEPLPAVNIEDNNDQVTSNNDFPEDVQQNFFKSAHPHNKKHASPNYKHPFYASAGSPNPRKQDQNETTVTLHSESSEYGSVKTISNDKSKSDPIITPPIRPTDEQLLNDHSVSYSEVNSVDFAPQKAAPNPPVVNYDDKEETNESSEISEANLPSFDSEDKNPKGKKFRGITQSHRPKSKPKEAKVADVTRKPSEKFLKSTYQTNERNDLDDLIDHFFDDV